MPRQTARATRAATFSSSSSTHLTPHGHGSWFDTVCVKYIQTVEHRRVQDQHQQNSLHTHARSCYLHCVACLTPSRDWQLHQLHRWLRLTSSAVEFGISRHVYVHPRLHKSAANGALLHQGRAMAARALVAARHRDVRLGVSEADNARRLATNGRLRNLRPAGTELRVGERRHGGGRRRRQW